MGNRTAIKYRRRVTWVEKDCGLAEEVSALKRIRMDYKARFASETESIHKALSDEVHIRVPHAPSIIISNPFHHCFYYNLL